MATKKKAVRKAAAAPKASGSVVDMLAKELSGAAAPSLASLARTIQASLAVAALQPWLALLDSHVFALDSDSGQRWYCIVMGAAKEVFGLQAYRGDAGFALFDDIQNNRLADSAEFLARQDLFTIEFVLRTEYTPLDRSILALSSDPVPPGTRVPHLRVSRPRLFPWYPHAQDVDEINDCLMAALLFFEWLAKHPTAKPWAKAGELPLLTHRSTDLSVTQIPHPARPAPDRPSPTKLDERRINQLLAKVPSRSPGHPVEADVFLLRSAMRDDGLPYFPWMALAADSSEGYLFPPVLSGHANREDILLDCVLGALEHSPHRPTAYHVRDEFCRKALDPIAQIFSIPIKIADLPAVAEARTALESQMLGG